jgi:hypothetical protein
MWMRTLHSHIYDWYYGEEENSEKKVEQYEFYLIDDNSSIQLHLFIVEKGCKKRKLSTVALDY